MMIHSYKNLVFPFSVWLLFIGITLLIWNTQVRHERQLLLHHMQTSAEQARIRFEGLMASRIASLEVLADRWMERVPPDFSQERFLSFSETLMRRYPGFQSIWWINSEGTVQYVFPQQPPGSVEWERYRRGSVVMEAALRKSGAYPVAPLVSWIDSGTGGERIEVLLPLIYHDRIQGALSAIFPMNRLVGLTFPPEMLNSFQISLYDRGQPLYRTGLSAREGVSADFYIARDLRVGSKTWQLELAPASNYSMSAGTFLFPAFGLIISSLLSATLYMLMRRMDLYRASRDMAVHEVNERVKIEGTLRENEKKLKALLAELGAKSAELESFVYTVSHDLKTPLVTIEGFIGALREDFGEHLNGEGERYLKYMSDACRKMESLITDLLSLSRIGRITEKKTIFPMGEVVRESLELLRPQIEARGIEVTVRDDLPEVHGERKRIAQLMDNLLSNAVKYIGKDNPYPRINIGQELQDGQNIFFIQDNGIGIEERYFDKIFQIFQRLPSAKEAGEGTGMGLTIARRIVDYHGGRIWLTSTPGAGTAFYFTLTSEESRHE